MCPSSGEATPTPMLAAGDNLSSYYTVFFLLATSYPLWYLHMGFPHRFFGSFMLIGTQHATTRFAYWRPADAM